jgi:small multidrug resistance family-3 protein
VGDIAGRLCACFDVRLLRAEDNVIFTMTVLVGAAMLEVGGDALMRLGLHQSPVWLAAAVLVLGAYGFTVNQGALDFGRLMGAYIAVFFVVSQVIALTAFHNPPGLRTLAGGALIVAGGIVMMV